MVGTDPVVRLQAVLTATRFRSALPPLARRFACSKAAAKLHAAGLAADDVQTLATLDEEKAETPGALLAHLRPTRSGARATRPASRAIAGASFLRPGGWFDGRRNLYTSRAIAGASFLRQLRQRAFGILGASSRAIAGASFLRRTAGGDA